MFIFPGRELGSSLLLILNWLGRWLPFEHLLHLDNQHLFLQCHAAIFIVASGFKMDQMVHLLHQIHTESHSNVNLCPVFT